MGETAKVTIEAADFDDQGRVGALLLACYGPALAAEQEAARAAGLATVSVEDELMAVDDFHFGNVDLMNCCFVARAEGEEEPVGVATLNPYLREIGFLAVRPAWRRRGVGSRLLRRVLAALRERGVDQVKIDLPEQPELPEAGPFLAAHGFREARRTVRWGRAVDEA